MSERLDIKDKALLLIEALVAEGIPFDLEFDIAMGREEDTKLIEISKIFSTIYRFAHVAQNPSCISVHGNWVKQLNNTYRSFHKKGKI